MTPTCPINVRNERLRLGFTQEVLARLIGVDRKTVSRWERGLRKPTADHLREMDSLGIDVLYVVTGRRRTELTTEQSTAPAAPSRPSFLSRLLACLRGQ